MEIRSLATSACIRTLSMGIHEPLRYNRTMKVPCLLPLLAAQAFCDLSSPPLVSYATYLGGAGGSGAQGLAVDSAGYAYVSGVAGSPDFPFTENPLGPDPLSFPCGFVTKLNPLGTGIVWSVCLTVPSGGRIALDGSGSIYVLSYLGSTVTKLTPNGDKILYSTTISSSTGRSMAVDPAGNVYVTGVAGAGLPATPGAYRTTCSGAACSEAFVAKLNRTGTVEYVTYMGYQGGANAIAVDSRGAAWITGSIYPTQGAPSGFVAKLDAAGARVLYATGAFGGGRNRYGSQGFGVAVDWQDAAYVVGSGDFAPTTPGSVQPTTQPYGAPVGFVIKFASNGEIVYGTYVGRIQKSISSVAVDAEGRAYFGLSGYPDGGGFLCPSLGTQMMVLSPDGSKVVASTRQFPSANGPIALDGKGGVYLASAASTTVFLTTPGAFQTQYSGGGNNAFVAKFDFTQPAAPDLACVVNAATLRVGVGTSFGFFDGAVAAGEVVTLFGHGISPGPDLRVTFDGMPAPLLYSDTGQINAVVPFGIGLRSPTFLSVQTGTHTIGPVKLPVVPAQPGLFTAGGQAAILNEDGSVNSSANPALRGSIISAYMTGVGMYKGGLILPDGSLGPLQPPFPVPVLPVGATVNGESAQVLFAGQAPGLIAGVAQVNLRVPDDAQSGMARLIVYVGNYASPYGGNPFLAIR